MATFCCNPAPRIPNQGHGQPSEPTPRPEDSSIDLARAARMDQVRRDLEKHYGRRSITRIFGWMAALFVIGILALAAIPLQSCGRRESKSSEARAALGTIKDRLRVKFIQNKDKADTSWRLTDLVNLVELDGKYYGSADYSLVDLTENTAVFRAAANTNTTSPQVTMTITNIKTGAATLTSP